MLKLDHQLSDHGADPLIPLYPDEFLGAGEELAGPILEEMIQTLGDGSWDGDLDAWPEQLSPGVRRLITTDQSQCTGRRCPHISQCSFFRAREGLEEADVVVTNHDLVLSDLRLGGGVILPAPEDSLYVFDEGHQLPAKCLNQFTLRFHSEDTRCGQRRWLAASAVWVAQGLMSVQTVDDIARGRPHKAVRMSPNSSGSHCQRPISRCGARFPMAAFLQTREQAAGLVAQGSALPRGNTLGGGVREQPDVGILSADSDR